MLKKKKDLESQTASLGERNFTRIKWDLLGHLTVSKNNGDIERYLSQKRKKVSAPRSSHAWGFLLNISLTFLFKLAGGQGLLLILKESDWHMIPVCPDPDSPEHGHSSGSCSLGRQQARVESSSLGPVSAIPTCCWSKTQLITKYVLRLNNHVIGSYVP